MDIYKVDTGNVKIFHLHFLLILHQLWTDFLFLVTSLRFLSNVIMVNRHFAFNETETVHFYDTHACCCADEINVEQWRHAFYSIRSKSLQQKYFWIKSTLLAETLFHTSHIGFQYLRLSREKYLNLISLSNFDVTNSLKFELTAAK